MLGSGNVDHELERLARRLQERAGADFLGDGTHQVDDAVTNQEPAVVVQQLPGEREYQVVITADRRQRTGLAGDGRGAQKLKCSDIKEQVEEQTAERRGVADQLGAGVVVTDRLAGQAIKPDAGGGEAGLAAPGRRMAAGLSAGGVVDGHRIAVRLQHEDEVLAEVEPACIAPGKFATAANQGDQLAGNALDVPVAGVQDLDRAQVRRQNGVFEQDGHEPAGGRPMSGEERGPFRLDPFAMERLGREHQRHRSAVEHGVAEAEDPRISRSQTALILEDC